MKKKLYFCSRKNNIYYMPVSKKSYDSDPQPSLMVAEPTASYNATHVRKTERLTVEEYFDEVKRVLHKKY